MQHTQSPPIKGGDRRNDAKSSVSLTSSSLKAQLDASRRPPQGHHVRRAVSSHLTPLKAKDEQKERPKTAEGKRSLPSKRTDNAPVERVESKSTSARSSSAKWASPPVAPTPPPSRSNSKSSISARSPPIKSTKIDPGSTSMQQTGPRPSPPKRTRSKLKLKESPSPPKRTSLPASARSSSSRNPYANIKPAQGIESRSSSSPPKRTPPRLRLRRGTPAVNLAVPGEAGSSERIDRPSSACQIAKSPSVVDLSTLGTEAEPGKD